MRWLLLAVGMVCPLLGVVWILQGVGIMPGSFMSNVIRWAYYGLGMVGLGAVLLVMFGIASRRSRATH